MARGDKREHQLDAERAVLGSLLIDPSIIRELLAEVQEQDFLHPTNLLVFNAARTLFRSGDPVDAIVIRDRIGEQYTDYLVQLMEITPTSVNWDFYARMMHEQAVVQRCRDLAERLSLAATLDECRPAAAQLQQPLADG